MNSVHAATDVQKVIDETYVQPEYVLGSSPVSYTHLRAHETVLDLVCRLLLEKKKHTLSTISLICMLTPHPLPYLASSAASDVYKRQM
ncbi:hypothetical protein PVA38_12345 [Streptococcus pneumoniae D39]|nr:hypothetical protein PVA38_12345 [Streptococcus pneumoniae D39]